MKTNGTVNGVYRKSTKKAVAKVADVENVALLEPEETDIPVTSVEEVVKISRQELLESTNYNREQILALVGMYMNLQKLRVGASNKVSAHKRGKDILSDTLVIQKMKEDLYKLEKQAAFAMGKYAMSHPLGRWCLSLFGVGPIATAGLLAHVNFTKCVCQGFKGLPPEEIPTHKCPGLSYAGQLWSFAGICPKKPWEKGTPRPFNAPLKTLLWNLGKNFAKRKNDPRCFYAQMYDARKKIEIQNNESGKYSELALGKLRDARKQGRRLSALQIEAWSNGRLQPAGLEQRACNHAIKIFLSHYFHVGYEMLHGKEPPNLWIMENSRGQHHRYIPPPNWPGEF